MKRNVLYLIVQPVHTRPPCMMEICTLKDWGIDVSVLTTDCSKEAMELLQEKGISVEFIQYKKHPVKLIQKAWNYVNYKKTFGSFFRKYWTDHSVLWIGTEQTAVKFWRYIKNIHPRIINALEFYEQEWYQTSMPDICRTSEVTTACEPSRAQYMIDWWQLEKPPYILRNKPYEHPQTRFMEGSTPELREAIEKIRGKKTIVYQGAITGDRDLSLLAKALKKMDSDYYLVLSGKNDDHGAEKLAEIYEKTIFLGNLPAPLHLEVTSHAGICVAFYKDNCINNRYCAPNKIYEYAGFGIPMLCNPIPGLTETVGRSGAGECVDFQDADALIQAIQKINDHYEIYAKASKKFFDDTDNTETLQKIIEDAFSHTRGERS